MKFTLAAVFTFFMVLHSVESPGAAKAKVLPFKTWKQKKVDEARAVIADFKRAVRQASGDETAGLKTRLTQAEYNLGMTRELAANDYMELYVFPQFKDDREALKSAAKSLSAADMAEILGAYQRRLSQAEIIGSIMDKKLSNAP